LPHDTLKGNILMSAIERLEGEILTLNFQIPGVLYKGAFQGDGVYFVVSHSCLSQRSLWFEKLTNGLSKRSLWFEKLTNRLSKRSLWFEKLTNRLSKRSLSLSK
jgi:hypothetical protein